ncbi:hypothetical protein ILUMI_11874 [Ignelater luminosus]|uniref:C-type lectin domain-containing protein n=1 Tax=Ignelater luminosus TaxID=2038154 RepID=A0A8K0GA32_IGNLU|nr:hypothetical protein ILUMI_11874 [Ignelater luminosus]
MLHLIFCFALILQSSTKAQITEPAKTTISATRKRFFDFTEVEENAEAFIINDFEFIFVYQRLTAAKAYLECIDRYYGHLAILDDTYLQDEVARALSETRLLFDTLWIGARMKPGLDQWWWGNESRFTEQLNQTFIDKFEYVTYPPDIDPPLGIKAAKRECLGFGRRNHVTPQFRPLNCKVERSYICQRPKSFKEANSTHKDWIKVHNRLYKIYYDQVDWTLAYLWCYRKDPQADLAYIPDYETSQIIGRHLLIGRPSLENAWIGAKWKRDAYVFVDERVALSNTSDDSGYPPWRNGTIRKTNGCVLLDRHLSNITLFVPTSCRRVRPIICSKLDVREKKDYWDIIIGEFGYRIYFSKKSWENAKAKCEEDGKGRLIEANKTEHILNLLYIMGENKTAVQHIWLAGRYDMLQDPPVWTWVYSKEKIVKLNWWQNTTYTEAVERANVCLNMDRENHIEATHYGTRCSFEQSFVCLWPAEQLKHKIRTEKEIRTTPALDDTFR